MSAQQHRATNPWHRHLLSEASSDDDDHPLDAITLKTALSAWQRLFGERQAILGPKASIPLEQGSILGSGGIGVVYETSLDGVAVAWKRIYTRKLTDWHLNEAKILERLSQERHEHILTLIGSYIHRQRKGTHELAILTWPVARCDLSMLLHDIDLMIQWKSRDVEWDEHDRSAPAQEDEKIAFDNLIQLAGLETERSRTFTWILRENLLAVTARRLRESIGCIATAVQWLHDKNIRHKDLKPSQILVSSDGLWLSDFGWSKDVSQLTSSETSGGDRITVRYHAPERAQMERCGRPEDIFALGCTYLEMAFRIHGLHAETYLKSQGVPMWSFQAHLKEVQSWLSPLYVTDSVGNLAQNNLIVLIGRMIEQNPDKRPTIEKVHQNLRLWHGEHSFFDLCCLSRSPILTSVSSSAYAFTSEEEDSVTDEQDNADVDELPLMWHEDAMQPVYRRGDSSAAASGEGVVEDQSYVSFAANVDTKNDVSPPVVKEDHGLMAENNADYDRGEGSTVPPDNSFAAMSADTYHVNPWDVFQDVARRRRPTRREYDPRIAWHFASHQSALEKHQNRLI